MPRKAPKAAKPTLGNVGDGITPEWLQEHGRLRDAKRLAEFYRLSTLYRSRQKEALSHGDKPIATTLGMLASQFEQKAENIISERRAVAAESALRPALAEAETGRRVRAANALGGRKGVRTRTKLKMSPDALAAELQQIVETSGLARVLAKRRLCKQYGVTPHALNRKLALAKPNSN